MISLASFFNTIFMFGSVGFLFFADCAAATPNAATHNAAADAAAVAAGLQV
jgi:hypothetical protein